MLFLLSETSLRTQRDGGIALTKDQLDAGFLLIFDKPPLKMLYYYQ